MTKIKIVSNPYEQITSFYSWDTGKMCWNDISKIDTNSKLLTNKNINGFFPFTVSEIVKNISDEYEGDQIEIIFEGTEDEFFDLEEMCKSSKNTANIKLERSSKHLENAVDILPEIEKIFRKVEPLVTKSVDDLSGIQKKMNQFCDATNDVIPICVIGNYSSGKSTFINALIGHEILPSGNEPVTARVYRISKSERNDQATVSFKADEQNIVIKISDKRDIVDCVQEDTPLVQSLYIALDKYSDKNIDTKLNKVLLALNKFEKRNRDYPLSDLIEIRIPIKNGWMVEGSHRFVIFDTPGSNSNSNQKHSLVLREAMENLSNGIPIFVSDINGLDTNDSAQLYDDIKEMNGFDTRFTMIVISKAESADLSNYDEEPEEEIDTIMNQSIPKNMYSEGIFFTSSIMGLGAKNDGIFLDEHSAEVFEEKRIKFSDPTAKFYKQLYKYNIMPPHLKNRAVKLADECKNKLHANSGLLSVEQEIITFAEKYSAYNKCKKAQLFLEKVIDMTNEEIEKKRGHTKDIISSLKKQLDESKTNLTAKINQTCDELKEKSLDEYSGSIEDTIQNVRQQEYKDNFKDLSDFFAEEQKQMKDYATIDKAAVEARNAVNQNLIKNIKKAMKERRFASFSETGKTYINDLRGLKEHIDNRDKLKEEIDQAAADELVYKVNQDYQDSTKKIEEEIYKSSLSYWQTCSNRILKDVHILVTESEELSDTDKSIIISFISSYNNLNIDDTDVIFVKEDFEYNTLLKLFVYPSDTLNLEKFKRNYNQAIDSRVDEIFESISKQHKMLFKQWVWEFESNILQNIISLNPILLRQNENIINEEKSLADLEMRKLKMDEYKQKISEKMKWI